MQFQTYANQNAYNTLQKIMTEQTIPETGKTTMEQLQKMGIAQGDGVGAEIMRKNIGDLMSKLSLYGGDLLQKEASSTEAANIRKESMDFTRERTKVDQDWQTAWRNELRAYEKSLEPSAATKKRKMWQGILQTVLKTGVAAASGGLAAPSLFGEGTTFWQGALKGAMFGFPGMGAIAGQNIGMQKLIQMMKEMGTTSVGGYKTFLPPNLSADTNNKLNLSTFNNPYNTANLTNFMGLND